MEIASDLVKILLECKQEVPDFLESYKPADELLVFDDNSEVSDTDDAGAGEAGGWGSSEKAAETHADSVKQESVLSDEKPVSAPSCARSPAAHEKLAEPSDTWPHPEILPKAAARSSLAEFSWASAQDW